jgi:hypothetical protein
VPPLQAATYIAHCASTQPRQHVRASRSRLRHTTELALGNWAQHCTQVRTAAHPCILLLKPHATTTCLQQGQPLHPSCCPDAINTRPRIPTANIVCAMISKHCVTHCLLRMQPPRQPLRGISQLVGQGDLSKVGLQALARDLHYLRLANHSCQTTYATITLGSAQAEQLRFR